MTSGQNEARTEKRLSPADLHNLRFTRASMLKPGYVDAEVDRVLSRVAEELSRLYAEKAALRDEVRSLQAQVEGVVVPVAPSEQALRILSSAQQTADNYVAEAEEFSRQVTGEARVEYEEQVRRARENAGAIIQAAQEAAVKISGGSPAPEDPGRRSVEELEEQVAYLKAFGQACRVQLRSYLEALLTDVENEWGRADPALLPQAVPAAVPRQDRDGGEWTTTFESNTAGEAKQIEQAREKRPATTGSRPKR